MMRSQILFHICCRVRWPSNPERLDRRPHFIMLASEDVVQIWRNQKKKRGLTMASMGRASVTSKLARLMVHGRFNLMGDGAICRSYHMLAGASHALEACLVWSLFRTLLVCRTFRFLDGRLAYE